MAVHSHINSRKMYPRDLDHRQQSEEESFTMTSSTNSSTCTSRESAMPGSIYTFSRSYSYGQYGQHCHGMQHRTFDVGGTSTRVYGSYYSDKYFMTRLCPVDEGDDGEEPASLTDTEESHQQHDPPPTTRTRTASAGSNNGQPSSCSTSTSPEKAFIRRRRRHYYASNEDNLIHLGKDVDMMSNYSSVSSEMLPSTESSDASSSCPVSANSSSLTLSSSSPSSAFLKGLVIRHGHHGKPTTTSSSQHDDGSGETKHGSEKRIYSSNDDDVYSMRRRTPIQRNLPDLVSSVPHPRSESDKNSVASTSVSKTDDMDESNGSYSSYWNSWWGMLMGEDTTKETSLDTNEMQEDDGQNVSSSNHHPSDTSMRTKARLNSHSSASALYGKDRRRGVLIPKRLSM